MAFSLDSILLSLLVGAIAALALLTLAFVILDTRLRSNSINRIFRHLMYEDDIVKDSSDNKTQSEGAFTVLLLVSALFGLGIAMESGSDYINNSDYSVRSLFGVSSDQELKLKSLDVVLKGNIRSGHSDINLRTFYTDYVACKTMAQTEVPGPCQIVAKQASDLYYIAKNTAFSKDTYYEELDKIQSRIDFARSLSYTLMFLTITLSFGMLLAIFAEAIEFICKNMATWRLYHLRSWWTTQLADKDSYANHARNLAAKRLAFATLISFGFAFGAIKVWGDIESGYDNRVFGYFVCDSCVAGNSAGDSAVTTGETLPRADIPVSPFRKFEGPQSTSRFEPSAVLSLGLQKGRLRFLVANDKQGDALILYDLDPSGNMIVVGEFALAGLPVGASFKIEALAMTPLSANGASVLLVGGTEFLGRDRKAVIYQTQFSTQMAGGKGGDNLALRPLMVGGEADICNAFDYVRCDLEGLAISARQPDRVMVGFRRASVDKEPLTPGFWLGSFSLDQPARKGQRISNAGFPEKLSPLCPDLKTSAYGISDLAFDDHGSLLILSSYEADERCTAPLDQVKDQLTIHDVQGALWRVKSVEGVGQDRIGPDNIELVTAAAHKPEGVALIERDSDTVMLVFDDDAKRKALDRAPDTFPLRQNQSVFTVFKLQR
ncbi:MAG: hypothetical protein ACKVOP_00045 [Sphingomonadaceae bacterium]